MPHVTSADGIRIIYPIDGSGPAVILVIGSLHNGSENAPLGDRAVVAATRRLRLGE
ncbi:hypothetical protein [Mesorhizobium sp. Cs1299R1N3]|uniref:hypothetical protein n=1 Tax=Mesorhizobium sp. Cs1299R1N3 TaxID=3015173 RepID=UPI00301E2A3F